MITTINRAIAAKRASLDENEKQKGFTLIELLVVVLIIGILAAIAIPAFLNQRQGAWESAVKSDIANAAIAAETFAGENNGSYAGMDAADLKDAGYNKTADVTLTVTAADSQTYTFKATHASYTGFNWTYDAGTGVTTKNTTVAVP